MHSHLVSKNFVFFFQCAPAQSTFYYARPNTLLPHISHHFDLPTTLPQIIEYRPLSGRWHTFDSIEQLAVNVSLERQQHFRIVHRLSFFDALCGASKFPLEISSQQIRSNEYFKCESLTVVYFKPSSDGHYNTTACCSAYCRCLDKLLTSKVVALRPTTNVATISSAIPFLS